MPSAPPARDPSSPLDGITSSDARPTVRQLSAALELGRAARAAGGRLAVSEELLLERIAPGESSRRARLRTQAALHEAGLRAERAPDGRLIITAARRRRRGGGRPWLGLVASAVAALALATWIFDPDLDLPGGTPTPTPTPTPAATATATPVPTSSAPKTTAAVDQRRTEPTAKAPALAERERAARAKRARERREAKARARAEARRKRRARDRARCTRTERYIVRTTGDAPLGCEAFQRKMIQLRRIAPPRT